MDIYYATIPIFGDKRRSYREKQLTHVVSNQNKPQNYPIFTLDTYIGSFIFYYDVGPEKIDMDNPSIDKQEGPHILYKLVIK